MIVRFLCPGAGGGGNCLPRSSAFIVFTIHVIIICPLSNALSLGQTGRYSDSKSESEKNGRAG